MNSIYHSSRRRMAAQKSTGIQLYAAGIMSKLKAGFVFSPTEFAKAGEMPFLQSFRQGKFGKYTSQLDIEDALFDGTPSTWASGNAEIKELVSILRCASFSGFLTILL